jgi:two-component system, chemotaxis family, sensor kinase Cph1
MRMAVDLSNCDREPVHAPGAIQPFGYLLALEPSGRVVSHYSSNLTQLCGVPEEGEPFLLEEVFEQSSAALLYARCTGATADGSLPHARVTLIDGTMVRALAHRQGGRVIIELEPVEDEAADRLIEQQEALSAFAARLESFSTPLQICEAAVEAVGELCGYDRVMVYRFHEDLHGEVIAEQRQAHLESWLGLHYPATDIPAPARAIFAANRLRMIPDVGYAEVPIRSLAGAAPDLDLTRSLLRSVSPIHIEYLHNMRVRASLTLSIKHGDRLWGLVACHHYRGPRYASFSLRNACAVLAEYLSTAISLKEEQQGFAFRRDRAHVEQSLKSRMESAASIPGGLTASAPTILDLMEHETRGAAVIRDGEIATAGVVPSMEQIRELVRWLRQGANSPVFATNALSEHYPPAQAYAECASGLLASLTDRAEGACVLWFRPETIQTVTWGGNPEKAADVERMRIHPRKSFAAWKETIQRRSLPWHAWEIEAAATFRSTLATEELRRRLLSERKARAEADRANRSKEDFIAVISHDLRDPLSSISLNLELLRRLLSQPSQSAVRNAVASMERAVAQMRSLIKGLLDVSALEAGRLPLNIAAISATQLVRDCMDVLLPLAAEKSVALRMRTPDAEVTLPGDRDYLLQVCSNLVSNAIKFTPPGGQVEFALEQDGQTVTFKVSDTGVGVPADDLPNIFDRFWRARGAHGRGVGLGLAIAKGIVEAHDGSIDVTSEVGKGSTFWFTLPKRRDGTATPEA